MTSAADGASFRILYVCVGNICRSVLAERLTRHGITWRLGRQANRFAVGSAGTQARPGQPMHPYIDLILRERGADALGFAARQLSPALIRDSDLVLTATRAERDRAISMSPVALRRAFTLREFARLATDSGHTPRPGLLTSDDLEAQPPPALTDTSGVDIVERAGIIVADALSARGQRPYPDFLDDITDPPGTRSAFRACADGLAPVVDRVLDVLCAH